MKVKWFFVKLINTKRRASTLANFRRPWFVTAKDRRFPNSYHIWRVNRILGQIRRKLTKELEYIRGYLKCTGGPNLAALKNRFYYVDRQIKRGLYFWDFFFDIFLQRKSLYGRFLHECDLIAQECYLHFDEVLKDRRRFQLTPPICYLERGFSFATIRRGVVRRTPFPRYGMPFPVIKIPYDRMVNPWNLSSIFHETGHDIQSDVGLWKPVQVKVYKELRRNGLGPGVARVWAFWHKETFADLITVLFGGPAAVRSLMELMTKPDGLVKRFLPHDSHPTPYIRPLIGIHLLRRLGFPGEAQQLEHQWKQLYDIEAGHLIPKSLLKTLHRSIPTVVNTIVWKPYSQLGSRQLINFVRYSKGDHQQVLRQAWRLSKGLLIRGIALHHAVGAARYAFERREVNPERIRRLFRSYLYPRMLVKAAKRPTSKMVFVGRRTLKPQKLVEKNVHLDSLLRRKIAKTWRNRPLSEWTIRPRQRRQVLAPVRRPTPIPIREAG